MDWRFAAAGVLVFTAGGMKVEAAPVSTGEECATFEVEYLLNATVRISDTTMGAGDGSYANGPGRAVLRFENRGGEPGGNAKLIDYRMNDNFTVVSHALLWKAQVKADTVTRTTPNACGFAAEGVLEGHRLRWKGVWSGMRSDGSLVCEGGLCGKFGAPPAGRSELHIPPHPVNFLPFEYAPDLRTFRMGYAIVSRQSSPSQTSRIALSGREVRRTCVPVRPCQ